MNDKVAVIVTVYNKELYIKKCLKSLSNQTYKNIEVIIINDGSTDNSGEIIKKFCKSNANFKYLYKKNQGVSSARNYGLKYVNSKYLTFIDGDDYVAPDFIQKLVEYKNYDLVVCGYRQIIKNKINKEIIPENKDINSKDYQKYIFNKINFQFMCVCWGKLYKTEIIKKYNLIFDDLPIGEDTIFVFNYVSHCKKIRSIKYIGYNDSIIEGSLSHKSIKNLSYYNYLIIESGNKVFHYKYNKSWNFLFIRSIKIELSNSKSNKKSFYRECKNIVNDKDFKEINVKLIDDVKSMLIVQLLRYRCFKMLFVIFNVYS